MNEQERVMVTGSRRWGDTAVIRDSLARVWRPGRVLVHGACPTGADALAEACWLAWGGQVERWPADWSRLGRRAGPVRNRAMVASGVIGVVAFVLPDSRGTVDAIECARALGVPVWVRHTS